MTDHINLTAIGEAQASNYATSLAKATAIRKRWDADKANESSSGADTSDFRVTDVHLGDLQTDPIATVRRVYAELFDTELPTDVERTMRAWLADNPRDKRGKHRPSAADFGIDIADDPRYAAYREYFKVKPAASHRG